MKIPELLETERLILRRPLASDAESIFVRYASDPEVTRYLAWPRHSALEDTLGFIEFSDRAWDSDPGGPYLIELRSGGLVLGSAGFAFEGPLSAAVGYVLAEDAWGQGYATEALRALVKVATETGISRLSAYCHPDHSATIRVLEKCGFVMEAGQCRHGVFPNIGADEPLEVLLYARDFPK